MWTFLLLICGVLLLIFYFKIVKRYNYWKEKGVPFIKPLYIFGNFAENIFRVTSFADLLEKIYKEHSDVRYVGFYQFLSPVLMIRDPELIKKIVIKDFDSFPDRNSFIPVDADPLWSKNLFAMRSKDGWHEMRALLSPSFTSNKMRTMFSLMQECSKKFVDYLKTKDGKITMEMKDAFARFTSDVIATTAFGVTCDSHKERNNEFYLMAEEAVDFSGIKSLKFLGFSFSESLMKFLNIKIFNTKVSKFFRDVIRETLKIREENNIVRPDMLYLLMEARRKYREVNNENVMGEELTAGQECKTKSFAEKRFLDLTDENITAQCLIFFSAGLETVSTALSYISYELALNPDVQTKLRNEITNALKGTNAIISYDILLSMKYLDNVISETLRLHSPSTVNDRRCKKPYVIQPEKPGEKPLYLEKETMVWIPLRAIHKDPKYFPNPTKFDPSRFSDDNIQKIKPCTYMPFGVGPRQCIGSRFALVECKLIIAELMQIYEFVPVEETKIPIKLSTSNSFPHSQNGIWIGLNPINCF